MTPAETIHVRSIVEMNWIEVDDLRKQTNTVLIPVGQIAQHGRHLPLNTDVLQAEEACKRAVAKLRVRGKVVVLGPTIPFGHSPTHSQFPGHISLQPETLTNVILDVVGSLAQQGFERFVFFNVGGGNWGGLQNALFHLHNGRKVKVYLLSWFEMGRIWGPILETHRPLQGKHDGHAGELETSCVLAVAPHLVVIEALERFHSPVYSELLQLPFENMNMNERCMAIGLWDVAEISPSGMWGDATAATREKGERVFEAVAVAIAEHIVSYVWPAHP